ncbi:MAG TPA: hypothetical protein VMU43_14085 [Candidatus Acidoferrum sp.]|nr:hypothetical protein [Candidatus Acidoferrum sp.]
MKILGALVICLCLPGLAFAQRSGGSFGASSSVAAGYSGGGGGGAGGGGGEVNASLTHLPLTTFRYPEATNNGQYVPSGFVPFAKAVSEAKPSSEVGTFLPFEKAVEEGRIANEPPPSLGDFARQERARRAHNAMAH